MQFCNCLLYIPVRGIETVAALLASSIPVVPILNNAVERNFIIAVAVFDRKYLTLGIVTIFGLNKTIGPFREKRYFAGCRTISGNNLIDFRTIEKVIIQSITAFRRKRIPGISRNIAAKIDFCITVENSMPLVETSTGTAVV